MPGRWLRGRAISVRQVSERQGQTQPERDWPTLHPRNLAVHPPYRRALVIVLIAFAMGSLFVYSYIDALGHPVARRITTAVVGTSPVRAPFVAALEGASNKGLKLRSFPTQQAAEKAIGEQQVYVALVFSPDTPNAVSVLLSSASGPSVARVLSTSLPQAATRAGAVLTETDLHPLPSQDPSGLAAFYLTLGATILGFVTTFQLRANARPMPLPPWLAFTGGLAILGGLVLTAVVKGILHALPVPFFDGWGVVTLQMITATAVASLMATLIGRWAIIPTWLIFVVLGNTSSGGAVSPALLPQPFSFLSRALPSGATVSLLRTTAYFPDASRLEPLLVLIGWAVGAVGLLILASRLLKRGPGTPDPPRPVTASEAGASAASADG
jgi:hypothetical protein